MNKKDFPYLERGVSYLDSASSSQTPHDVLRAMDLFYTECRANVHRGMYKASEEATMRYESAREKVARFIGAGSDEIVFTRGATESLNIVARGLSSSLRKGDEVVITAMEHHANLVVWQEMAKQYGFTLRRIPLRSDYTLDMDAARTIISEKTKVLAVLHASNVLGTIVPVEDLIKLARNVGSSVVVDAAQTVARIPVSVKKLDCDFLVFSGHKVYGPTGIGALYGKRDQLLKLPPFLFGGDMINEVTWDHATWADVPKKFEAGTPNIAGAIGLGEAISYVEKRGISVIQKHEKEITSYALEKLSSLSGVKIIGPSIEKDRVGIISFILENTSPHDIATILDAKGVAVRGGHHCAMPLMRDLELPTGTTRASFGLYTEKEDIDALCSGILHVKKTLSV